MRPAAEPLRLHIERVVPGTPEDVFRAQTDPRAPARRWGRRGSRAPRSSPSPAPAAATGSPCGRPRGTRSTSRASSWVDPPSRLAHAFRWEEPDPDDRETLVTVTLAPRGEATAMTVDRGDLATAGRLALHAAGWTEALGRLARTLRDGAGREAGNPPPPVRAGTDGTPRPRGEHGAEPTAGGVR